MKLYGNLLRKKQTQLAQKMERFENGLQKLLTTASQVKQGHIFITWFSCLHTCAIDMLYSGTSSVHYAQVEDLKAKLALQEVELWQKNADIEALIAKIGQQTDKLNQERAVADAEEQKVRSHS